MVRTVSKLGGSIIGGAGGPVALSLMQRVATRAVEDLPPWLPERERETSKLGGNIGLLAQRAPLEGIMIMAEGGVAPLLIVKSLDVL